MPLFVFFTLKKKTVSITSISILLLSQKQPLGSVLLKRCSPFPGCHIVKIDWSALEEKFILTGDCFSFQAIVPAMKAVYVPQKLRCSVTKNKLRKDALSFPGYPGNHYNARLLLIPSCPFANHKREPHHFPRKKANTSTESL